jgi:hypothetical protein
MHVDIRTWALVLGRVFPTVGDERYVEVEGRSID